MKQFLFKIGIFLLLFFAINTLVFVSIQRESIGLDIENKRISFVENAQESPKMIVSGGSNVGYSLDSELLTQQLNIQTYNVSFSISHDYEFVLNYIASNLKKGDIFLYIPEFDNYYITNENRMSDALTASIYNKPSLYKQLNFTQKINFLTKIPKINMLLAYKNLKYFYNGTVATSLSANIRGDYTHHLDQPQTWEKSAITRYDKFQYEGKLSEHFKKVLKKAQQTAKQNGATFLVSYPSIAASQYDTRFKKDLKKFYQNSNIKVIGNIENYTFQDQLMYDHPYHTTREGRKIRTELLAKDIQNALATQ